MYTKHIGAQPRPRGAGPLGAGPGGGAPRAAKPGRARARPPDLGGALLQIRATRASWDLAAARCVPVAGGPTGTAGLLNGDVPCVAFHPFQWPASFDAL